MKVFAETERLILREIILEDVDAFFELDSDPEVHRYLGNKPVTEKQQIIDVIHYVRRQYSEHGIGRWAVVLKETNEFIGWSGLKWVTDIINGHQNFYDLGYRLQKRFWGHGYATESAIMALDYGYNFLQIAKINASANCENIGSNRILTKLGMDCLNTYYYEDILCNWYELSKEKYLAKTSSIG
ncbi:MAG: GNAT family N-acetyltransferase [Lewinellaceae bacterium]|nr:GNAT family N-acetyltransferase [Lewinellaceae bacterium]